MSKVLLERGPGRWFWDMTLFGSRAYGVALHNSDVDLLVQYQPPALHADACLSHEKDKMLQKSALDFCPSSSLSTSARSQESRA